MKNVLGNFKISQGKPLLLLNLGVIDFVFLSRSTSESSSSSGTPKRKLAIPSRVRVSAWYRIIM